jgi:hypothetical protein
MPESLMIELHSSCCGCGGGSWVTGPGQGSPPCAADSGTLPAGAVLLSMRQWQEMGRPRNAEASASISDRTRTVERRQFKRFKLALRVRIQKPASAQGTPESEETMTEDLGIHGARVRCRLAVDIGAVVVFEDLDGGFQARAEVRSVFVGADRVQRLGLTFLDTPFPTERIPSNAAEAGTARVAS